MSATNNEMEMILSYIPTIYPVHLPKFKLLKIFHKDQRKKKGPRFTVFLADESNNLYRQCLDINKDPVNMFLRGERISKGPEFFYTGFYRIDKIKKPKKGLEIHDTFINSPIATEGADKIHPYIHLDPKEDREEFVFIANFFKVPLISEEDDLRKKYGKVECVQCGKCCRHYRRVKILTSDKNRWRKEKRYDIFLQLHDNLLSIKEHKSGHCPFLVKNLCSIHDTKPKNCIAWPSYMKNRKDVGCGGLKKRA